MLAEVFGDNWLTMDLPFPCEIHAFHPRPSILPNAKKVLAIFTEPKLGMVDNNWVLQNYKQFDLIVTYDRALAHLPNVRILDYGGTHCNQLPPIKDFSVSFVLSTGSNDPRFKGYDIRRHLALNLGYATIHTRLFLSSQKLAMTQEQVDGIVGRAQESNYSVAMMGPTKDAAFRSMFHVAIENNVDDYYFSEKITDCFRTFTVPIYWGTNKVLELFDKDGIIFVEDGMRIHEVIASLTLEDYWKRAKAMANNYIIAEKYMNIAGDLRGVIMRNIQSSV